jgi:hypothetical protein
MHLPHRHQTRKPVRIPQAPPLEFRHWFIETTFRPHQKRENARLSGLRTTSSLKIYPLEPEKTQSEKVALLPTSAEKKAVLRGF